MTDNQSRSSLHLPSRNAPIPTALGLPEPALSLSKACDFDLGILQCRTPIRRLAGSLTRCQDPPATMSPHLSCFQHFAFATGVQTISPSRRTMEMGKPMHPSASKPIDSKESKSRQTCAYAENSVYIRKNSGHISPQARSFNAIILLKTNNLNRNEASSFPARTPKPKIPAWGFTPAPPLPPPFFHPATLASRPSSGSLRVLSMLRREGEGSNAASEVLLS